MVGLSAPLVVAVVLPTFRHVPQVLTPPEVLLLVTDPSAKDANQTPFFTVDPSNDTPLPTFTPYYIFISFPVIIFYSNRVRVHVAVVTGGGPPDLRSALHLHRVASVGEVLVTEPGTV